MLLAVAGCGTADEPSDSPAVQTEGAAVEADAAEIAKSLEVTPAEAARRLRAQAVLGDHLARLREVHRDRLAGVYYQHQPDFRLVVRLKGDAPVPPHPLNRSPVDGVPIEFRPGAPLTLDELAAGRDRHADALRAVPGLQGLGTDERTGTIQLTVHAPGQEGAVGGQIADLQARLGLPLTVEFVPEPVSVEPGGTR
jgi:streptogrisin C